jgi:hypothetical protein
MKITKSIPKRGALRMRANSFCQLNLAQFHADNSALADVRGKRTLKSPYYFLSKKISYTKRSKRKRN